MAAGATVNINDSVTLTRNSTTRLDFSGTVNFNDDSNLVVSQLRLIDNVQLNWNSAGTFSSYGTSSAANFEMRSTDNNDDSVVNMSAGQWFLTGNTITDSIFLEAGNLNLTGGSIVTDQRLRLDGTARLNLGGTGTVLAGSLLIMDSSTARLNFQGLQSALLLRNDDGDNWQNYLSNVRPTFVYIDDVQQSDGSNLQFSTVTIGDDEFTRVSVIPEPGTAGSLLVGLLVLLAHSMRERRS